MIEHGLYCHPGPPLLVARERSLLPCGCCAVVGIRMDTHEVAVGSCPCGPGHKRMLERFVFALGDSLVNPTDRPLIDVVDELLTVEGERVTA